MTNAPVLTKSRAALIAKSLADRELITSLTNLAMKGMTIQQAAANLGWVYHTTWKRVRRFGLEEFFEEAQADLRRASCIKENKRRKLNGIAKRN
jgi:molybdenum-dependent DNA-binding transcriptional regulator ModE